MHAETGRCNLWDRKEDLGGSSNLYLYSPQVVDFSPNGGDAQQQRSGSVPEAVENIDNCIEYNDIDNCTAYNVLISSLKTEYDSRLAVDKWFKQYPSAASSLSADEFVGALKLTLLSLEQSAIARELVSSLGSGVLNTNYILAAMSIFETNVGQCD